MTVGEHPQWDEETCLTEGTCYICECLPCQCDDDQREEDEDIYQMMVGESFR